VSLCVDDYFLLAQLITGTNYGLRIRLLTTTRLLRPTGLAFFVNIVGHFKIFIRLSCLIVTQFELLILEFVIPKRATAIFF